MSLFDSQTPRRGFLGGIAASTAALLLNGFSSADAALPGFGVAADEAWVGRIKGKHRQVVDCTSHDDGFGVAYGLNFIDTTKEALKLTDKDFTSVVSYRHWAMPLMLNDAMWSKYKIGEVLNITDPKTKAPATRNIFRDNILARPGLTYEQVMTTRPVIMTACNVALTVLSGIAAAKAGVSADEAKKEWTANLLTGANLVPSGVYALNRAQQTGCTYCNGR